MPSNNRYVEIGPFTPFPLPISLPDPLDPDAGSAVLVGVPDAWLPQILGALKVLAQPETWAGANDTECSDAARYGQRLLEILAEGGSLTMSYPKRALCWHRDSIVLVGNALVSTVDTGEFFYHKTRQNAPANGDTFTSNIYLAAGTYDFLVDGHIENSCGKLDWYIDGALVVSGQDWYNVGAAANVRKTDSVIVGTDGPHTLKGVVNGKNASSSSYNIYLVRYQFRPSAD